VKKPTAFLKILITTGFLSLLLLNVGSVKGASAPGGPDNLPAQAKRSGTALEKASDQNWLDDQEDKHERFNQLEWLIKQSLLMQYQRMEVKEELEDLPD